MTRTTVCLGLALGGCAARVPLGEDTESTGAVAATSNLSGIVPTDDADADSADDGVAFDDFLNLPPPPDDCDDDHPCLLDILVVVDNSADMAEAQGALVRGLIPLVQRLETHVDGAEVPVDVQMMFTTTDVEDPACTQFNRPDYESANGAPTTTGCNARINDFTGVGSHPEIADALCTTTCPTDVVPSDPFVAFYRDVSSNVPEGPARDIDGDGQPDSAVAQAVACLASQGINGCGYESPLGAMMRALDPTATWNGGARPFLREGSRVVIVLLTTEIDCSNDDASVLNDPSLWNIDPQSRFPQRSSGTCWNAAMSCGDPDAQGNYVDCTLRDEPLTPVSRYRQRLVDELGMLEGREVNMVAITGVPEVDGRSEVPPFEPIHGGVGSLTIHDFRDGPPPGGDMFPSEIMDGVSAAKRQWEYGIGSGCVSVDGEHVARGLPNPRINEVCAALDGVDGEVRCCVESVCDPIARLDCIDGWVAR